MPAYGVFDVLEVTDAAKMGQYRQGVLATIQKYGGRVLVAGGAFNVVEGTAKPTFPVILEFPSVEAASWNARPSSSGTRAGFSIWVTHLVSGAYIRRKSTS